VAKPKEPVRADGESHSGTVELDEVGRLNILEEEVVDPDSGERLEGEDIFYCERSCACGSVLSIRGRRYHLFNLNDRDSSDIVDGWDAKHSKEPHAPATREDALAFRELRGAFDG